MPEGSYPKETIRDLVEGRLSWERVKWIVSNHKDEDRFDKYVEVLQERVPWPERILLPLTDELYIVEREEDRLVKCACGHDFGDYRENWKLKALIHVRDTDEEIEELYPATYPSRPDREQCEIREYYCPGCGNQLEVETVPFGYPIVFDFLPDLDSFYREWLDRPLRTEKEFKDLSYRVIDGWASKG